MTEPDSPPSAAAEPTLTPVFVVGPGRVGTTLLMQVLGSSTQVAFDRRYPFEHRYLCYLLRWAELVRAGERTADWDSAAMLSGREPAIGPLPWNDPLLLEHESETSNPLAARLLRAAWVEVSQNARAYMQAAHGASEVTHYAEKAPDGHAARIAAIVPSLRLAIVRDPRDQFLSILAFNERRGTLRFGVRADDTAASFAERFALGQRQRLERLAGQLDEADVTLVRYEDLAIALEREAERIGRIIGTELDPGTVIAERRSYRRHMTSESPEASVERWRREMDTSVRAIFRDALADLLARFGYSVEPG